MAEKKKIPCRVCGKLFEPCAYCQSHADVFRWRNFACSRECAAKYIDDTIAYRESLKNKETGTVKNKVETVAEEVSTEKTVTTRKKTNKKASVEVNVDTVEDNSEIEIENNETE